MTTSNLSVGVEMRARQILEAENLDVHRRTDRWFAHLMFYQFSGAIVAAMLISPRAWSPAMSQVHPHIWTALLLGGAILSLPVTMAILMPGRLATRMVIACGQMLTSALLIHITGGRIETHFHIFGSLAFLAFYRDWRVFIPATLVITSDHLLRGMFWPESVFGVIAASPWRSVEHAWWVIFEDVFLVRSCILSVRAMKEIALRRAQLESSHAAVEEKVQERTAQLQTKQATLEREIAERKAAEAARETMQQRLLEVSRRAGMAEVATGVLHNVGNVLNSVNVSATTVSDRVKKSPAGDVAAIAKMLREQADLAGFLSSDEKGRVVPAYLQELGEFMLQEQTVLLSEIESLGRNVEHIRDIVGMQQSYARIGGAVETVRLNEVIEDALRINLAGLQRHGVSVERQFDASIPPATLQRQKLLQVMVNLLSNAKYALDKCDRAERIITVRLEHSNSNPDAARISVIDNGIGIAAENMPRLFSHGFTTRRDGHGFGLHSCAAAARELGGHVTAHSNGPGQGATFILELPLQPVEVAA